MQRLLDAVGQNVRELGVVNGLIATFARALDRLSGGRCRLFKYYFVAQPVAPASHAHARRVGKIRIYRAAPHDAIIAEFPRPPHIISRRFADGSQCLVAEHAGTLVGFLWIKHEQYDEDEVRCRYRLRAEDGLAWDYDAYIAPEYRMTRAFAQLWAAAHDMLREQQCAWTISRISAFSAASLASHRRLGMVRLFSGLFLQLGGAQVALFTRRPYVHVSFAAKHAPTLRFRAPDRS